MSKVAVISGAGSGVGRAVSMALSSAGYTLALAGRNLETLQETQNNLEYPNKAKVIVTDVSVHSSVELLFQQTIQTWGRVDLLFNNAGIGTPPIPLEELDIALWHQVVNTNLNGMFYCLREAFKYMKTQNPQGGRIINNGSISATTPRPHSIAYTATKHAVSGLTKSAALDGRPYNIAVGQIDIGNAATPMTKRMSQGVLQANGTTQIEPVMDVSIVGSAVVYMASLPLEANVLFHTVMATTMPFVGRG
ncbi:MAG: SDR family oxidoreductase [Gammaproteobacteria bacterium]|nr:SDR family oxidoreductase [Gammaproteobacteria bacterium]